MTLYTLHNFIYTDLLMNMLYFKQIMSSKSFQNLYNSFALDHLQMLIIK